MPPRIVLASHQHLFRALLCEHLQQHAQLEIAAEFSTVGELQSGTRGMSGIDLLLVDTDMPGENLLIALDDSLTRRVSKVALITDVPGAYLAESAIRLGLRGILHKRDSLELFRSAVRTILSGGLWISSQVDFAGRSSFVRILSPREIDVIRLHAEGRSTSAIARLLKLSPSTVLTHRRNCMRKLNIRSQLGLTLFARASGMVPTDCLGLARPTSGG